MPMDQQHRRAASPPLAPSAGIPGPITTRLLVAAMCETYRTSRAAGRSIEEAVTESSEAGQRAARIMSACASADTAQDVATKSIAEALK